MSQVLVPQILFILVFDAKNRISSIIFISKLNLENDFPRNAGETQEPHAKGDLRHTPTFFYLVGSCLKQVGNSKCVFGHSHNANKRVKFHFPNYSGF